MTKLSAMAWIGLSLAACDATQDLGGSTAGSGGSDGEGGAAVTGPGSGAGSPSSTSGGPTTSATSNGAGGDPGGGGASSSSGTGGAGPECNDLLEQGSSYAFTATPPPAPAPEGGAIEEGVYVISSETAYTNTNQAPADVPGRWTLEVIGTTMNRVVAGVHQTFEMSFPDDTSLLRTTLCDDQTPEAEGTMFTVGYTATPDSFTEFLELDFGQGPEQDVYTWIKLP